MTGETKIGLITGLSVIIVFAMILSHKGAGQPQLSPPARTAFLEPDSVQPETVPAPVLPIFQEDQTAAQPDPHPTSPEPTQPQSTQAIARNESLTVPAPESPSGTPDIFSSDRFLPIQSPATAAPDPAHMPDSLRNQIEGRSPTPLEHKAPYPIPPPPAAVPTQKLRPDNSTEKIYLAQAHDTLTSIAQRFLGDGSRKNVDRIFELNRKILPDRDSLKIGQKLRLPSVRTATTATANTHPNTERSRPTRASEARKFVTYKVRPGDSYVAIARNQLGNPNRWREIFELNKTRFPDPDQLLAGVNIKVPAQPHQGIKLARR